MCTTKKRCFLLTPVSLSLQSVADLLWIARKKHTANPKISKRTQHATCGCIIKFKGASDRASFALIAYRQHHLCDEWYVLEYCSVP